MFHAFHFWSGMNIKQGQQMLISETRIEFYIVALISPLKMHRVDVGYLCWKKRQFSCIMDQNTMLASVAHPESCHYTYKILVFV